MKNLRAIEIYNSCRSIFVCEKSIHDLFLKLDQNGRFCLMEGDLSVAFVSKKKIRALHGVFLGDDSATDVITFPGDPELNFAGEIVVCLSYALEQSKIYGTTFEEEVKLYLVHGFLHLCGLGDKTIEEAREMRLGEAFCINFLKNFPLQITPGAPPRTPQGVGDSLVSLQESRGEAAGLL
ncbi:MAG: rRNA maturation RNase YbeY [Puniceicoccales bacterium]|nr:rRNA maturation RNase YbeY [Puniceicoccales bacterium]